MNVRELARKKKKNKTKTIEKNS
jgi:hypothetical protein